MALIDIGMNGLLSTSRAGLIARMLEGAWRASPPEPKISAKELAEVGPLLLGSGAGALGWWRIRESGLSASPAALELQQSYRLHALQALLCKQNLKDAVSTFRAHGIEPILIKGWANARLYPQPGLRPYGDMDLCVRPDQYAEASGLTSKLHTIGFHPVDLHKALGRLDARRWDEFYARSQVVSLDEVKVRVLSLEDHLHILCVHMLEDGAWRPILLCDIAVAVEAAGSGFDWDVCLGRDKRRARWVASAISLAHRILGARVEDCPAEVRAAKLPRWLLPTVLRNWERPRINEHYPPELIAWTLRHPKRLPKALAVRWPDPISATVRLKGSFNQMPRLPFQLADYFIKNGKFLMRLPRMVRARQ